MSHRRHSVHHPGSQSACRITQGAGSLPCALRVTASQNVRPHISLTIRLLVCINYRDRVLFPKPWEVRAEKNLWYRCKIGGAKHSYRPVDSASVMQYLGRWLTRRQYPIAKATVSLRRLMTRSEPRCTPVLVSTESSGTLLFRTGIIPSLGIHPERWQSLRRRQLLG